MESATEDRRRSKAKAKEWVSARWNENDLADLESLVLIRRRIEGRNITRSEVIRMAVRNELARLRGSRKSA